MKMSNQAIAKLKEFEGLRLRSYQDQVGVWTVGWGHTKNVRQNQTITMSLAEQYLRSDLAPLESSITQMGIAKTQGQFDALVDFCFNLGIGKLRASTLLKKIIAGSPTAAIQAEFKKWVYAGGKVAKGLVKRRAWEAEQWAR